MRFKKSCNIVLFLIFIQLTFLVNYSTSKKLNNVFYSGQILVDESEDDHEEEPQFRCSNMLEVINYVQSADLKMSAILKQLELDVMNLEEQLDNKGNKIILATNNKLLEKKYLHFTKRTIEQIKIIKGAIDAVVSVYKEKMSSNCRRKLLEINDNIQKQINTILAELNKKI